MCSFCDAEVEVTFKVFFLTTEPHFFEEHISYSSEPEWTDTICSLNIRPNTVSIAGNEAFHMNLNKCQDFINIFVPSVHRWWYILKVYRILLHSGPLPVERHLRHKLI